MKNITMKEVREDGVAKYKLNHFYTTMTYSHDYNGFEVLIDIVDNLYEETYEAWIYMKEYGIKSFMFGIKQEEESYETFKEIVEANLYIEDYIPNYLRMVNGEREV